jgi:hypothetical protein
METHKLNTVAASPLQKMVMRVWLFFHNLEHHSFISRWFFEREAKRNRYTVYEEYCSCGVMTVWKKDG